jgi:hypothetical protein
VVPVALALSSSIIPTRSIVSFKIPIAVVPVVPVIPVVPVVSVVPVVTAAAARALSLCRIITVAARLVATRKRG